MTGQESIPDFNEQCALILRRWQAGELPFRDAASYLEALGQQAIQEQNTANQARIEFSWGYMQGYRSNLNESIKHFERARELYEIAKDDRRVLSCDLNLGESHRRKGDFTRARELFRAAYERSMQLGEIRTQTIARANEGQMLLSMGQMNSARMILQEALQLAERWEPQHRQSLVGLLCEIYHALAVIYLNENNVEAAWEEAKQALGAAQEFNQPLEIGYANRTLGEVLTAYQNAPLDSDVSTNPDDYFKASIEAFRSLDAEGEVARTLHVFARSLAKRGKRVPAARQLQQATLIFAKLGMVDDAAKAAESQSEIF
ncbi:MAG: tetratricopeptide repeat protein [Anaerolineales bacterium]|nr:tetratricopeptide repeat protein [Anaerolineales bacterium]